MARSTTKPLIAPSATVTSSHALSGKHAVMVGINFAPEPTGIAPYNTGMAEHLARFAQSFTVLTGMPHYPTWSLPPMYRWVFRAREEAKLPNKSGFLIHRLRHYVPAQQSALTRAAYEATFLMNAWGTRLLHAPNLVLAVTPSLGGALAGARLAKRHHAPLIIVVQDLMAKAAGQSGISGGGRVSKVTARLESYVLRQADRVAIVSESFRAQLEEYGVEPSRISLLPNWTHIQPAGVSRISARHSLNWPLYPFTVVHTGNIGLKQDLGNLVEAARKCQHAKGINFVIVGDGSQRRSVQAQAAGLDNLLFVDPLDADAYPKALAAADLLVVNERPTVGDMSLPSKITSYLVSGRAVVAAVSNEGATAHELTRSGGAEVVAPGDPALLAQTVLRLSEDAIGCARMAAQGRDYASGALGHDAAMDRLDSLIAEVLSTR